MFLEGFNSAFSLGFKAPEASRVRTYGSLICDRKAGQSVWDA